MPSLERGGAVPENSTPDARGVRPTCALLGHVPPARLTRLDRKLTEEFYPKEAQAAAPAQK